MKKLALLTIAVLAASAVFAAQMDLAPGVPPKDPVSIASPTYSTDAWGQLLRSFQVQPTYIGGVAVHPDGYISVAHWGSSFTAFYVYTTTGSLVRSVSGLSGTSNGFRDASGWCHLGTGYFVAAQESGGVRAWPYSTGGNPGTSSTSVIGGANGRGVSYDGTYYYATQGGYSSAIGIYTTSGSLVGTIPGSGAAPWYPKYGSACRFNQRDGYLVSLTYNYGVRDGNISTGSIRRSFATATDFAAGADFGWDSDKELYIGDQGTPSEVYVYEAGGGGVSVEPVALGKIKSLYR
jgi:hypothetical protein